MTRAADLPTLTDWRARHPGPLAFVPTMGALHDGHLDLVRAARAKTGAVAVSIFVNPTQFGPHEDLSKYPRPLDADLALLRRENADLVFTPTVSDVYPADFATTVTVADPALPYEGERRPGHFAGVATVVARLANLVRPDLSVFGLKDLQQCAVLFRLWRDLALPGAIAFRPTVRESDGLAMSSRNRYFSPETRAAAVAFPQALDRVAANPDARPQALEDLAQKGFDVEYLDWIDPLTFAPADPGTGALVAAARFAKVRLIDNRLLTPPPGWTILT